MKSKKIIAAAIIVILIAGGLLYYEFGYNTGGKRSNMRTFRIYVDSGVFF